MPEKKLREQINAVVEARGKVQVATVERTASYQNWLDSAQFLIATEGNAKTICQEAEAKLRELALQSYAETGEKSVAPGVGIREVTKLDYDSKVALTWGIEHHGIALKLDTKAFENVVKATPSIVDFVTVTQEPQATIATELNKVE